MRDFKFKRLVALFALTTLSTPTTLVHALDTEDVLGEVPLMDIQMDETFYVAQGPLPITIEVSDPVRSIVVWFSEADIRLLDADDDGEIDSDVAVSNTFQLRRILTPEAGTYTVYLDGDFESLNGDANEGENMFDYNEETGKIDDEKVLVEGDYNLRFMPFDQENGGGFVTTRNNDGEGNALGNGYSLNIVRDDLVATTQNDLPEEQEQLFYCSDFLDVDYGDDTCEAIRYVSENGIMTGYENGDFGPNDVLNRAQIVKIALELYGLYDENVDYTNGQKPFPDVELGKWYTNYVARAKELGITKGNEGGDNDGLFLPNENVNRVEFLAFLLREMEDKMPEASDCYDDATAEDWFSAYACFSKEHQLLVADGSNLNTSQDMQRSEVAVAIYQLHLAGFLN